jgi:mono/diheme cytochrome c family protein
MMIAVRILAGSLLIVFASPGDPWRAPAGADKLKDPTADERKAAAIGGKIFRSQCWACHGMDGRGDGPAAEALTIKPADLGSAFVQAQSNGAIYWKITHGRGEMASYEQALAREDRWALAHYIRTLAHE